MDAGTQQLASLLNWRPLVPLGRFRALAAGLQRADELGQAAATDDSRCPTTSRGPTGIGDRFAKTHGLHITIDIIAPVQNISQINCQVTTKMSLNPD